MILNAVKGFFYKIQIKGRLQTEKCSSLFFLQHLQGEKKGSHFEQFN